jgi:hypothetical protein
VLAVCGARRWALTTGWLRPDHPVIQAILSRVQSDSSLRLLLRSPIGFLWRYGLRWRAPESGDEPLVLDALAFGDLVHESLDVTVCALEQSGGLAAATREEVAAALEQASEIRPERWAAERAVPPRVIWRRTWSRCAPWGDGALGLIRPSRARDLSARSRSAGRSPALTRKRRGTPMRLCIIPAPVSVSGYIDRLDLRSRRSDRTRPRLQDGRALKAECARRRPRTATLPLRVRVRERPRRRRRNLGVADTSSATGARWSLTIRKRATQAAEH